MADIMIAMIAMNRHNFLVSQFFNSSPMKSHNAIIYLIISYLGVLRSCLVLLHSINFCNKHRPIPPAQYPIANPIPSTMADAMRLTIFFIALLF